MHLWSILVLIIVLLVSIIASQNTTPLVLHFFSWQTLPMPLAVLIIGTFLLGIVFSFVLSISKILRMGRKIKKLERELLANKHGDDETR